MGIGRRDVQKFLLLILSYSTLATFKSWPCTFVPYDIFAPFPHPCLNILHKVVRVLKAVAAFPDGIYTSFIADPTVLGSLNRIANNAYPGFRPAVIGGETALTAVRSLTALKKRALKTPGRTHTGEGEQPRSPPPSAFGLPKPTSPEGQLISELAREVAYLIGVTRSQKVSTLTPAVAQPGLPTEVHRQEEPRAKARPGTDDAADRKGTNEQRKAHAHAEVATVSANNVMPNRREAIAERQGMVGVAEATVDGSIPAAAPEKKVLEDTIILGRPGTYLGCGVTNCGGLGVAGKHGDKNCNVPHASFVMRKVDGLNLKDDKSESNSFIKSSKGDFPSKGSRMRKKEGGTGSEAPGEVVACSQDVIATPLTLLSARDASFRTELVRRKEHYHLGGTGNDTASDAEEAGVASPLQAPLTPFDFNKNREARTPPSLSIEKGHSRQESRRANTTRGKKKSGAVSPVLVDTAQSPLMASTRPTGAQPFSMVSSPVSDVLNPRKPDQPGTPLSTQEFVTFARPAAHWAVTASMSCGGSPARGEGGRRSAKGVRMPGALPSDGRVGSVVGRFACRGYLLDPTFVDDNPVIQHPRLPRIADDGSGASASFSQTPEGTILDDIVAAQAAKGVGGAKGTVDEGRGGGGLEPYRNTVEVLHHRVSVAGARKAGKRRFFDEYGRPLSPVNFHHVYDCLEKRRAARQTSLDYFPLD